MTGAVNYKEGVIEMADRKGRPVRISEKTRTGLLEIGRMGQTFNDVIAKLLDDRKAEKKAARGRTKVKAA